MLSGFKRYLARQQFIPGKSGIFFNPYFIARRALLLSVKRLAHSFKGGTVLDVGCGIKPYQELFDLDFYWGIDILGGGHSDEAKECALFFDGKTLPVKSSSVDKVISNQVLEHVFTPDRFMGEIYRILKPGGLLLLTVPMVWDEHEVPYDYARYTSFGIRDILARNGFEITEQLKSTSYLETVFQMLSAYVAGISNNFNKYIQLLIVMCICSIIQITGILLSTILPKRGGFYLDNVILAIKKVR